MAATLTTPEPAPAAPLPLSTPNEYRDLPLTSLQESPTNPRRRFDENALNELAASIAAQGVLAPLLVRPLTEDRYEVVAGARRFRAAQRAGLTHVPCRVRTMTDAAVIECQVVENSQREGVHPLEEAQGFVALMQLGEPCYDIAAIAAKLGKSERYVATHARLVDLIPPVAEAFLADRLTTAHALLIARLPQSQQEAAFEAAFRETYGMGGPEERLVPVKDLAAWIEQHLLRELATAVFDIADATLVPEAGACPDCPQRTGANKLLFADTLRQDACCNGDCWSRKVQAHTERLIQVRPALLRLSADWATRQAGALGRGRYTELRLDPPNLKGKRAKTAAPVPAHQARCPHASEGVFVNGPRQGTVATVCAAPECKLHGEHRPAVVSPEQRAAEEQRRREEREAAHRDVLVRERLLKGVLGRVPHPLTRHDLRLLADAHLARLTWEQRRTVAVRHVLVAKDADSAKVDRALASWLDTRDAIELGRLLVELALLPELAHHGALPESSPLLVTARRYELDPARVTAEVQAECDRKARQRADRQKVAPAAKKPAAKKAKAAR